VVLSAGRALRRGTPYLVLASVWALVVGAYAPGQVNADTLAQIQQIEDGLYNDWFAPLLDALWSIPYELGFQLIPVLAAQVGALLSGLYLIARAFLPRLAAAVSASAVLLFPPVLGLVGLLGRDIWFTALIVLAAGCLVRASGARGRRAVAWFALFAVTVLLATAARQNALPMTFAITAAGSFVAMARLRRLPRRRLARLLAPLAIGVVATLAVVGFLRLSYAVLDVYPMHPEQMTFSWDLTSLSVREGEVLIPPTIYPEQDLATLERAFDPDTIVELILPADDPLLELATTGVPLTDARYEALRDAWWSAISDDPGEYVAGRIDLWLRLIHVNRAPAQVAPFDQAGENQGYGHWSPDLLEGVRDYVALFTAPVEHGTDPYERGSILFTVVIYLLTALAGGALLLRRALRTQEWVWLAPAGLLVGAVAYELTLAISLPAAHYRWSYPLVVCALGVALPAGVALARGLPARRLSRAGQAA
jgi:hypothetical protein